MSPVVLDSLLVVSSLALLSAAVVMCDALGLARGVLKRHRRRKAGVYGVVVDPYGTVIGTYLDPFAAPGLQGARVHDTTSPWSRAGADGRHLWAWEGFGLTIAEAHDAADRLRIRHLKLFPWLGEPDGGDDAHGHLHFPVSPPGSWE